ncbi:MAG: DUF5683 domain-containing protein [Culturomica sp.]|nr:DUF5683 domain-containing protein [Culturomica sp.]
MRALLLFITVFLFSHAGQAQWVNREPDSLTLKADTLTETVVAEESSHSPHKATIMALVLPGSGQVYNRQWWKLPVLAGGIGAAVYGLNWNTKTYKKYRRAFVDYTVYLENKKEDPDFPYPENPSWSDIYMGNVADFSPSRQQNFKQQLQNRKDRYKRDRDLLYIVMGGIYAIQIIDACVFAHFYDYELDENLTLNLQPALLYSPDIGAVTGVTVTLNF